jgi:hypothetical protein
MEPFSSGGDPMKRLMKMGTVLFVVLLAALSVPTVRAETLTVALDQNRYMPSFDPRAYERYRGLRVYMPSFTSRAENTGMNYYYGAGQSALYTGYPTLESYAWYCFEKALKRVGLQVFDHEAVPGMGEMRVTILSLSAGEFVFAVELYRAGLIKLSHQEFRVVLPPAPGGRDPGELERYAYLMMDRAVTRVLDDPSFERTLRGVAR